jgi:hypothetical protein
MAGVVGVQEVRSLEVAALAMKEAGEEPFPSLAIASHERRQPS